MKLNLHPCFHNPVEGPDAFHHGLKVCCRGIGEKQNNCTFEGYNITIEEN